MSDALCRLATGGGLGRRRLYTNEEETQLAAIRPTINGISEEMMSRCGLRDRTFPNQLLGIPDHCRRTEAEIWRELEEARPRLLGAWLDAVAVALSRESHVRRTRLPRMADCARWVEASSPALGWREGEFVELCFRLRDEAENNALSLWPVTGPLNQLLDAHGGTWTSTVGDWLRALNIVRPNPSSPPPAA
jgi:putative DNA primase/helicase